jgi:hypothetical protein
MGYFFEALCCCKILVFILINFLGYTFDEFSNLMQIGWALLIYAVCYSFMDDRGVYKRV